MKTFYLPLLLIIIFTFQSCSTFKTESLMETHYLHALIPKPVSLQQEEGVFSLNADTRIIVKPFNNEIIKIGQYLAEKIKPSTGYNIKVTETYSSKGNIFLIISNSVPELGEEGYLLEVRPDSVLLSANKPAGLFRGIQTIRQLLPHKIDNETRQESPWNISACIIKDYPRFQWRSAMLDVARHFFSVKDVKRYIDLLAYYKMNRFHMHLSDDQGWRIEIKSWKNLTDYGSLTQVGGGKGGYYNQEEYSELVRYAADRYITIIPEIEMPGHINAALASYPELNFDDSTASLYTGTECGFSSLCLTKDITYQFIDDVIRELSAITPGPYLHIGGDETYKIKNDDYIKFINKAEKIVNKYGKIMIGWEEIGQAEINNSSIAQHWAGRHAIEAVNKGCKVILSPGSKVYLDMKYDSTTVLGLQWAGFVEVKDSYDWDPAEYLDSVKAKDILGVEAPLWSETAETIKDIEFLVFPRVVGVAELGWSPEKNWDDYKNRLRLHGKRFNELNINYYRSPQIQWID